MKQNSKICLIHLKATPVTIGLHKNVNNTKILTPEKSINQVNSTPIEKEHQTAKTVRRIEDIRVQIGKNKMVAPSARERWVEKTRGGLRPGVDQTGC